MPRKQLAHAVRANPNSTVPMHQPRPWTLADTAAADYMRSSEYDPCGKYAEPVWCRPPVITYAKPPVDGTWRGVGGGMTLKDAGGES